MAHFQDLPEDIFLLIFLLLPFRCILRTRQTCLAANRASRMKLLWLHLLWTLESERQIVLSPREHMCAFLDSSEVEALVARATAVIWDAEAGRLEAKNIYRLDLPRSVDWTRLVNSRWLFVASYDRFSSMLSCWDISLVFNGRTTPVAECTLPGRVKTAQSEIQAEGIVIALGIVGPGVSATHILSLRQHQGKHVFVDLCRLERSTHVVLLSGDFIVCTFHNDLVAMQLINWKSLRVYPVPAPKILPLVSTISMNYLILFYNGCGALIFKMPTEAEPLHVVANPWFWISEGMQEAVVLPPGHEQSLPVFLLLSEAGVRFVALENSSESEESFQFSVRHSLKKNIAHWDRRYSICAGSSGQTFLWLNEGDGDPYLGYAVSHKDNSFRWFVPNDVPIPTHRLEQPQYSPETISWGIRSYSLHMKRICDPSLLPALWALPHIDFDDSAGLAVIGNVFGELTLIDFVGDNIAPVSRTMDCISKPINSSLASQEPIPLDLPFWVPMVKTAYLHKYPIPSPPIPQDWGKEILPSDLPPDWSVDWPCVNGWEGSMGDVAWSVELYFGYVGPVQPIAFQHSQFSQIFRAGGLLFKHISDNLMELWVCPGDTSIVALMTLDYDALSLLAKVSSVKWGSFDHPHILEFMFVDNLSSEYRKNRNRWAEQVMRGGCPPEEVLRIDKWGDIWNDSD